MVWKVRLDRQEAVLTGPGDFAAAMKGIQAKALVVPSQTDLYFREYPKAMYRDVLTSPKRQRTPRLRWRT
jgi:homoserine acetyltransferase